jgi:uncharacterized protein (DUF1800 family)
MRSGPGKLALFLLCLSLACAAPQLVAKKKDKGKATDSAEVEQRRAVHALNRLTFGPRPGDAQQVLEMGVEQWIDLQLHPDKIRDSAVESRLAAFRTLHMSSKEIVEEFPDQQMIRAVMDGKKPMPSDAARRAVFQVQIARMQEKKERKAEAASGAGAASVPNNAGPAPQAAVESAGAMAPNGADAGTENASGATADAVAANGPGNETALSAAPGNDNTMSPPAAPGADEMKPAPPEDPAAARRREQRLYADLSIQQLVDLPADQRYKKILAMSTDEQLALADSLRGGKGLEFLSGMDAKQRETLLAMNNPQGVVMEELVQAKLLRAIYSERQLEEVMTDFWFNHFNVYANKGADRLLLTSYEQDVIRPRALGKFEDLLVATAKSPAMLFYLDNWLSVGPESAQALGVPARAAGPYGPWGRRYPPRVPRPNAKRKQNSGLNENYGRELLELHTLSVNGGYSQRDVTEVAKVFTGWTIEKPFEGGSFRYDPRRHEPGPKFVLGHRIKPKGEEEGREVLHRLATSPQTAHFISQKLAQRFVSDDPPAELVDRMAKSFLKKKGDIREVLSTLFHSPEFWDEQTHRAKVKTPLEFVASAVRATGADVEDALPLTRQLNNMGMPLYGAQPPTGYSMKAETWVSSSALLNRMNFAVALTSGKVRGVKMDAASLAGSGAPSGDAAVALSAIEGRLLAGEVSKQTHESIVAQIEGAGKSAQQKPESGKRAEVSRAPDVGVIAGLLLGSPEFQRR